MNCACKNGLHEVWCPERFTAPVGQPEVNELKFPALKAFVPPKYAYFFYGYADETSVPSLCEQAEDDGCEILHLLPAMIPAPRGLILPPGAPNVITVLKIFVRCPRSEFEPLQKKIRERGAIL